MPSQSQVQPLTAGIVGAGIAGISTGIALRRAGLQVHIYERSRFSNEIGAAITVPPNASAVLRHWGFDFKAAKSIPNVSTRYISATDLETISEFHYHDIDKAMGSRTMSFHRVDLHQGLRALATESEESSEYSASESESADKVSKDMPVAIHLGREVQSVDCEKGILTLANGSTVQKDLIVIADGAHSNLLEDFLGRQSPAQPTGRSIYRWIVSMEDVMSDPELAVPFREQHKGFIGWTDAAKGILWISYTCRGGTLLSNAVVHNTEEQGPSHSSSSGTDGLSGHGAQGQQATDRQDDAENTPWHTPVTKEAATETCSNFHPALRRIISLASEDGIRVHKLFKRPPLESFVRGRTVIIGDAAHVMMPTHAAGCSTAIESAGVLEGLFKGCTASMEIKQVIGENASLKRELRRSTAAATEM
ncbi:hypothetical protein NUW58_g6716 [Xylaria curta]|uniref:Uncharacterized protein n=1 Tax=Xylaria curta TaxID=42375 RepID=A0ACC1NQZ1_9PEZI|nr:hypothetical protein NUW58_g6716 [Xylaria curta]